ncbi:TPA: NAD(P)H-binding protein [Serratia odorifera]|jgi:uncharacterized protein YbjT (DUF2867 family)|uniref:NAD(P)H-binding protein n=1 Tax=Serratia odorifera TaxID=618 RepID=UPI00235DCD6C|nr:NAD(P)H-binding protein [Serratia odorifera]
MSHVFIIGAAGKIGRRLIPRLASRGLQPYALHRHAEQAGELSALGAIPVAGNLLALDAPALARLMTGSEVVIFTAGAGGKGGPAMTQAIDGDGLTTAIAAAKLAGIRRFLLVSAFPDALRGGKASEQFEHYMAVKKRADVQLVESELDWIILRPGTLRDDVGTGKVRADVAIPYGDVSRDDVAATLVALIEQPEVNRVIIELTQGDLPVEQAVRRLAH